MKLSDLKLNEDNPRFIRDERFAKLVKSIEAFPKMLKLRPIVVDENSIVLGGNMRLRALQELGYKEIPDEWVRKADELTPEQKREFVIKDNVGFGEWSWDALANEWDVDELAEWGLDMPEDWGGEELEAEDDNYSVPDELPVDVVYGDLIEIGPHRLLCGDSTSADDVGRVMGGELADLYLSDPPYGVSYVDKNEFLNAIDKPISVVNRIENDHKTLEEMFEFWCSVFSLACGVLKSKSSYYIFSPQGGDLLLLLRAVRDSGFQLKHVLVWAKNNHVLGRCDYNYKHEPIVYGWKQGGTHDFFGKGEQLTSVWSYPKPLKNDLHPTMKPVEVLSNALLNSTLAGGVVFDNFLGSGSTIVAAHQLNRKCYGLEIDPKYCQVIIDRMYRLDPSLTIKINGEAYTPREPETVE